MLSFFFLFLSILCYSKSYSSTDRIWILSEGFGIPNKPLTYSPLTELGFPKENATQDPITIENLVKGRRPINYDISTNFKQNANLFSFSSHSLTSNTYNRLSESIQHNFSYIFVIDNERSFAPIGKIGSDYNLYYYSQIQFIIMYQNDQITQLITKVLDESLKKVTKSSQYSLSFSIQFQSTSISPSSNENPNDLRIHKLILIQLSIELLIVYVVLRFISNQIVSDTQLTNSTFSEFDEFDSNVKENGWKMLHGDIYRNPSHPTFLSILITSAFHISITLLITLSLFTIVNFLNGPEKVSNNLLNYVFFIFIGLSAFTGFCAIPLSKLLTLHRWMRIILGGTFLFPTFFWVMLFIMNYLGHRKIYFFSGLVLSTIIYVSTSILSIFGSVFGNRSTKCLSGFKLNVAMIQRHINPLPWYLQNDWTCFAVGIIISMSSISSLSFIYNSVYLEHEFNSYLFVLIEFVLIVLFSGIYTSIVIFFRLQNEDYRWQWISFLAPFSSAFFNFFFFFCFYLKFNLGFTLANLLAYCCGSFIICSIFGMAVGFAGYVGVNIFIRFAYSNLKLD